MITLYHGSYIAVSLPLVGLGRKTEDFVSRYLIHTISNGLSM